MATTRRTDRLRGPGTEAVAGPGGAAPTAGDPRLRLAAFVDRLRPMSPHDVAAAEANVRAETARLVANPAAARELSADLAALLALPGSAAFLAEAGVRSSVGFWLEIAQRIVGRLLPPVVDPPGLPEALDAVFRDRRDHLWVSGVSTESWLELAAAIRAGSGAGGSLPFDTVQGALSLLSWRLAGSSLDPELLHADPSVADEDSPFRAQSRRLGPLLERARRGGAAPTPEELREVLAELAGCRRALEGVHRIAGEKGVSLRLTYLLHLLRQLVDRLDALIRTLSVENSLREEIDLLKELLAAREKRFEIVSFAGENLSLLARNVTEQASRRGEHYIAEDRRELREMAKSAAGGGVVIAVMALLKIRISMLHLPPLADALAIGLNYGLGFVLIHLLGFTVATKQPAMTAATLAAGIEVAGERGTGSLVDRVRDGFRTQLVAIVGNVGLALPVAVLLVLAWQAAFSSPPCPPEKAEHLLADIHPFRTGAILWAAVAGVGLFLSGLASGFFDNQARYLGLRERVIAAAGRRGLAPERSRWLGEQVDVHYGAVLGNLLFGLYLGFVGASRYLTGLPLDIRHVAFASANLGTGVAVKGFSAVAAELPWTVAGLAGIALVNLLVSFALALGVATRSRGLGLESALPLAKLLAKRFLESPLTFFTPPAKERDGSRSSRRGH